MSKKLQTQETPPRNENWYELEELSERWNKPVSFIEQSIRKGKFGRVILRNRDKIRQSIDHCFFDKSLWPHGDRSWNHHEKGVGGEIDNLVDLTTLPPGGFLWSENRLVVIPEVEVMKFEQENNLNPDRQVLPPSQKPWKWIKSKDLCIAVEAYHHLYYSGNINAHLGHKLQIKQWLKDHYSNLSPNQREIIATVINQKKKGGAPSQ